MSKRSLRVFSREFKHWMVRRLEGGERVAVLAEEARVKPQLLYDWRAAYRAMGVAGLSRKRGRKPGWRRSRASAGLASSEASSSSNAAPSSAKPADELAKAEARIAELERLVGRQQVDLHLFSRSLAALGRDQPRQRRAHLDAIIQEMIAVASHGPRACR